MEKHSILVLIRKIIRAVNIDTKKIQKNYGVSIPQLLTIQFLMGQEDFKASSTSIKKHLVLNASTVTGIINRLLLKALVAKVPNPNDKRGYFIILTAKGAELLKKSPITLQEKINFKIKQLTPNEEKDLAKGIKLLVNLLDAESLDAAPMITTEDLTKIKSEILL